MTEGEDSHFEVMSGRVTTAQCAFLVL